MTRRLSIRARGRRLVAGSIGSRRVAVERDHSARALIVDAEGRTLGSVQRPDHDVDCDSYRSLRRVDTELPSEPSTASTRWRHGDVDGPQRVQSPDPRLRQRSHLSRPQNEVDPVPRGVGYDSRFGVRQETGKAELISLLGTLMVQRRIPAACDHMVVDVTAEHHLELGVADPPPGSRQEVLAIRQRTVGIDELISKALPSNRPMESQGEVVR